ncbi:MAG TPA: outer membrane protein assembly factor BamE [Vicinamibacterales bacterium]|nr:outer membrane protein assembly factor BamE [Vicinamibacterales bacterium]
MSIPASIRAIKVGMTEREVRAILGAPRRVRPWGKDAEIYDYAIPGWGLWSPQLWISFDHGRVHTVQGKRYPLIADDYAVYEARGDRPLFESSDFESTFARAR